MGYSPCLYADSDRSDPKAGNRNRRRPGSHERDRSMNTSVRMSVALCTVLAAGSSLSAEIVGGMPAAAQELMNMYPGSRVQEEQGRVRILYGVPMTPGLDARSAANLFIQQHGQAFGCGPL